MGMCFILPHFLLRKGNFWVAFVFKYIYISFVPALFETPLEEFELQLMDAERRLSPDSLETPCNITFRKDKRRHVTFDDESESTENQSKKTVEIGSQTETLPLNL
jgi:hypothetical protein